MNITEKIIHLQLKKRHDHIQLTIKSVVPEAEEKISYNTRHPSGPMTDCFTIGHLKIP